jgi:hypothetical protein
MPQSLKFLSIGSLGSGFRESSLERGLETGIDFIGADSGSTDGGPGCLAGIPPAFNYERDLSILLHASRRVDVPLLVGSCAISGRDWGVDYLAEIARAAAREHGLSFTMARIYSEVTPELVRAKLRAGQISPLHPAMPYDEETIARSIRMVSVMGVDPFQAALDQGADLVLAGRASDVSIFGAIPLARGIDPGTALHAARLAECGTNIAEPHRRLDLLHVDVEQDSFTVQALNDDVRCTPASVAAHQLFEVVDPHIRLEPGWKIDMTKARYDAVSDRSVRVSGGAATQMPYTVKLEGVESAGFQQMFMFSIRDPSILANIDEWMESVQSDIEGRCSEQVGIEALDRCQVHTRVYGRDGTMRGWEEVKRFEGHEAFFLIDVVGPDHATAEAVARIIQYALFHANSPRWGGSTVAQPFTNSVFDLGEVFRFNVNHVLSVDDPLETFRIEMEKVG